MNTIETYYMNARLSQAAYIDLSPARIGSDNPYSNVRIAAAADDQERVPFALAEDIFGAGPDAWTMLSPYYKTGSLTGHSDPASGFAAMLLSNPAYGKVLAIAGTEPTSGSGTQLYQDLMFSDVGQIGFLGAAFNQLVSLFNYVQELRAPVGATNVLRLEVVSGPEATSPVGSFVTSGGRFYSLVAHYDGQGKGLIGASETLTVTGHSLGGHLAALAVALFPDLFTAAYTYNAPGYDPLSRLLQIKGTDGLLDLFKPYGANPLAVESIGRRIVTLEAEDAIPGDDFEIVSSNLTGTPFSPETYVTTEKVTHDIGHMTEGLALQSMLAKLDSSMTLQKAGAILAAVTTQPGESYEKLLEDLNYLLTGTRITLPRTGPSASAIDGGNFATRNTFFEKYLALQNSVALTALAGHASIIPLATLSADGLKGLAIDGAIDALAYRYALQELIPFAVLGDNSLYAKFNTHHELDLYDAATGTGTLTERWIEDRAALLANVIIANTDDSRSGDTLVIHPNGGDTVLYQDLARGVTLRDGPTALDPRRITFGSDNPETIKGGSQADHLYGGAGNDFISGDGGHDELFGGDGDDTLVGDSSRLDAQYHGADFKHLCLSKSRRWRYGKETASSSDCGQWRAVA